MERVEFNKSRFNSFESTYDATESEIQHMLDSGKLEKHHVGRYNADFVYNEGSKTAALLKFVVKSPKPAYIKKRNRSYKSPHDQASRVTTTSVAYRLITQFMNDSRFAVYELVISVGSYDHESCVFLRKNSGKTEAIYYNPNYSKKTKGVQFCATANALLKNFGNALTTVQSFTSPCFNLKGFCCQLTWERIHNFVLNGETPFNDASLNLTDYNHLLTPYSYRKYFKRDPVNEIDLKHYEIWRDVEKIMRGHKATRKDEMNISKLLSGIILKELCE